MSDKERFIVIVIFSIVTFGFILTRSYNLGVPFKVFFKMAPYIFCAYLLLRNQKKKKG